ncbi:DUF2339 domain-containing protein [Nitratifractor salsuginis]|uniref:DUF2339 domain-containing protein n=1 Tax=Nitratifractor salsuginis (strain DSM 16511 / JCM 12458 / E9I37-1) TaxID=749222 RepID=E6X2A1_NITSE|nr:DUF2339 domain-containing protein [Nitratifractor salsuginis]ADV46036.1 Protein of unknown function DUF2339, transmembrane [Nitratifractor salsuginis DSM 16511]
MEFTLLLLILLALWILTLQSRVKRLEEKMKELSYEEPQDESCTRTAEPAVAAPVAVRDVTIETSHLPPDTSDTDFRSLEAPAERIEKAAGERPAASPQASGLFHEISRRLFGGNILVRLGGVVLFFGLAFLAKYAAAHTHLSPEMKVAGLIAVGLGIGALGWRLRRRPGAYGMILQGVGAATVYLSLFAAQKFYGILTPAETFAAMLIAVAATVWLALRQDAQPLALFAEAGGFLVPILTDTRHGDVTLFFGYYALLDLGIGLLALRRAWPLLNLAGFLFTYLIATLWGVLNYRPESFAVIEPFWIYFYLLYLALPILEARTGHRLHRRLPFNAAVVFGLPLLALPQQLRLVQNIEHGDLATSVILGILYLLLALWLHRRAYGRKLSRAYGALGLIFLTLAVPLYFGEESTAAIWALEGAVLLYRAGTKTPLRLWEFAGHALLLAALVLLCLHGCTSPTHALAGRLAIVASYLAAAWALDRPAAVVSFFRGSAAFYFALAVLVWILSLYTPLRDLGVLPRHILPLSLLLGSLVLELLHFRLRWPRLLRAQALYGPLALLGFFWDLIEGQRLFHPFAQYGWLLYLALLAWGYRLLWRYQDHWESARWLHLLWFESTLGLVTLEAGYWGERLIPAPEGKWLAMTLALMAGFAAAFLVPLPRRFAPFQTDYRLEGAAIPALFVAELMLYLGMFRGFWGPQIPLLNPLDLTQLAAALLLGLWIRRISPQLSPRTQPALQTLYGLVLLPLPAMLWSRAASRLFDIPWTLFDLGLSPIFQSGVSLIYTLIAFALVLAAKKRHNRLLWFVGFGLLVAVVLKLFLIDLSSTGTLARIVSFIGVGTVLLLLGYRVPLPPSHSDDEQIREPEAPDSLHSEEERGGRK